jgi:hypothetical protein
MRFCIVEKAVASSVSQLCVALLVKPREFLLGISSFLQSFYVIFAKQHFRFLAAHSTM